MSEPAERAATPEGPDEYSIGIAFGNSNSYIAHMGSVSGDADSRLGSSLTPSRMQRHRSSPTRKEVGDPLTPKSTTDFQDRLIPSVLSYVDGEEFYGTQAKAQLVRNHKNTVTYFRNLLGKEYGDQSPALPPQLTPADSSP